MRLRTTSKDVKLYNKNNQKTKNKAKIIKDQND